MLTELSKTGAPSLLLLDFNYFFNKAINLYINKKYNIYDINQLSTDDLRVLKATALLDVKEADDKYGSNLSAGKAKLFGAVYEVELPQDYLHMLNCICIYKMNKRHKCFNLNDYVDFSAKRLTADSWSTILNDYFNRPLPERPYYYIHNINTSEVNPYNPYDATNNDKIYGTDMAANDAESDKESYNMGNTTIEVTHKVGESLVWIKTGVIYTDSKYTNKAKSLDFSKVVTTYTLSNSSDIKSNLSRTITYGGKDIDAVEKHTAVRYGNPSKVRCEIRYGQKI